MTTTEADEAAARAEMLNGLGRHRDALELVTQALATAPDDPELLRQGGLARLGLGEPGAAVQMLNAAIAADPYSAAGLLLMSMALQAEGLHDQAVHAARRSVELSPHAAVTHAQLARALSDLPHAYPEARAAAEHAIRLDPQDPDNHLALGDVLFPEGPSPGRERLAEAEAAVRRALELDPGRTSALNDLARVQLARGRGLSAAGTLSQAVGTDPRDHALHHNMDLALTQMIGAAHWVLFVAFLVLRRVSDGYDRGPVVVLAVLASVLLGALVLRLVARLGGRAAAFVAGFARRNRVVAAWGVCLTLSTVAFLTAAAAPDAWRGPSVGVAAVALLLGAVLSWVAFFRGRRAAR